MTLFVVFLELTGLFQIGTNAAFAGFVKGQYGQSFLLRPGEEKYGLTLVEAKPERNLAYIMYKNGDVEPIYLSRIIPTPSTRIIKVDDNVNQYGEGHRKDLESQDKRIVYDSEQGELRDVDAEALRKISDGKIEIGPDTGLIEEGEEVIITAEEMRIAMGDEAYSNFVLLQERMFEMMWTNTFEKTNVVWR